MAVNRMLRLGGVLTALVLAYFAAGATLLNNASAIYFPRQLTVVLVAVAAASVAAAGLWRSVQWLLVAVAAAAAAALVSNPSFEDLRLQAFARAIPISSSHDRADSSARCFCATRASILEFFGPPDFLGDGNRGGARVYAYVQDRGISRLVLYEFEGRSGADDRVIGIREDAATPEILGLAPWQTGP